MCASFARSWSRCLTSGVIRAVTIAVFFFRISFLSPRRRKLHILCSAASGRAHSFRCSSSPHKIFDFAGTPLGQGVPGLCPGDCARCIAGRDACPTRGWVFAPMWPFSSPGSPSVHAPLCRRKTAHAASQRHTAGFFSGGRVDSDDLSDPGKIVTIGTAYLDEPLSIASPSSGCDAGFL